MTKKLNAKELQNLHFTQVENFFTEWLNNQKNKKILDTAKQNNRDVTSILNICFTQDRNPFLLDGIKIRNYNRKWEEAEKIIKKWKKQNYFDVIQFIINWQTDKTNMIYKVNDPINTIDSYTKIIGSYLVIEYISGNR